VSAATGLLAASHRPDDPTGLALRRGEAVNAAVNTSLLIGLLGIGGTEIQERGYVLTGLPRYVCNRLSKSSPSPLTSNRYLIHLKKNDGQTITKLAINITVTLIIFIYQ